MFANDAKTLSGTTGKSINQGLLGKIGWGTWIRTKINGVRVRRSTVELFPNSLAAVAPSFDRVGERAYNQKIGCCKYLI